MSDMWSHLIAKTVQRNWSNWWYGLFIVGAILVAGNAAAIFWRHSWALRL